MKYDIKKLNEYKDGELFIGYIYVLEAEIKLNRYEKQYYDIKGITSEKEHINIKYWDIKPDDTLPKEQSIIVCKGKINFFQNTPQLNLNQYRNLCDQDDEIEEYMFVKHAPVTPRECLNKIYSTIENFSSENLKMICKEVCKEYEEKLLYYPAAKSWHHEFLGGLVYHIYTMLQSAKALSTVYVNLNWDLVYSGIIVHDIAKIKEMATDNLALNTSYTKEGNLLGHISMGIIIIDEICKKLKIEGETPLLLKHMILSHHNVPEYGSPIPPLFPEAFILHEIDNIDAKLNWFEKEMDAMNTPGIGNYSKELQKNLYKPDYSQL